MTDPARYGIIAAFETPEALLTAATRARQRGLTAIDAFTPYPVTGLPELVGVRRSRIPIWAFIGGVVGGLGILGLMLFSTTVNYPLNVGGRPLASWTAFAVETFECIVLGAALVAFFGMLVGNRLPRLYDPVFNAQSFSLAQGNRFYLLVRADDPAYDRAQLRRLFRSWHALTIEDVAP